MSPEGAPKPQKTEAGEKRRSHWVEAGLVAGAMVSPLNHGPAQALEMDPHASWIAGVQDRIIPSTKKDKAEHAIVYMQFTDGSSEWVKPTKGLWNKVTIPVEKNIAEVQEKRRDRDIVRECHIHTHPQATTRRAFSLKGGDPFNPPSPADIQVSRDVPADYRAGGVDARSSVHAVFDTHGVWYFRPNTLEDYRKPADRALIEQVATTPRLQKEFADVWQQTMEKFIYGSVRPDFNFDRSYRVLQEAYRTGLFGSVRFVPNEEITNEPPCAGVDYDKEKGFTKDKKTLN